MKPRVIVLAMMVVAGSVFSPRTVSGTQTIQGGRMPEIVSRLRAIGELPKTQRLNMAIGLPLRDQPGLHALLQQLYDPTSPRYHRFLTPDQFTERFGPTETDYQAVMAFAKAAGLTVTHTYRNRALLDVSGAVADIEKTLHVTLRTYNHPTEPRTFYAPDNVPSLDLNVAVLSVAGLDNYALPRPMIHKALAPGQTARAQPQAGSGPSGNYLGKDFRAAYLPGVALTGSGQTVGLLEFDGYYARDIAAYENLAHLPAVLLTNILLDGFSGPPGGNNDEVSLDIEMAISMAPGLAEVVVYEGTTNGDDILNEMAAPSQGEPLSLQLSASWTFPIDASTDQIFQEYAVQGQTYYNASGDTCAYPTGADVPTPAGDTNITIVGGTTLTTSGPGGSWQAETAWNWAYLEDFGVGTGGGVTTFAIPTWQQGIDMLTNEGSTLFRNIPDVAMTADNVWVIYGNGQSNEFGGTSCATPLWAAFTALVNQQAAAFGRPPAGFINPAIYALAQGPFYGACFHDIATGNNTSGRSPNYYYAVPGYDLCTGWGTPNGASLINALAPPDWLMVTPANGVTSSGNPGGPFTVTAAGLTLTNTGTTALNWSLGNGAPWLNVSANAGFLAPHGASSAVTVSLNSAASNLVAGTYTALIWFTNLNDSVGQAFYFTLNVLAAPALTMQPLSQMVYSGSTVTFAASASGAMPLHYLWQQNGVALAGATNPIYTITNVPLSESGAQFSCVVSNVFGAITSSIASLTVVPPPFYSFSGPDGSNPYGGLVLGRDGCLYGATQNGETPDGQFAPGEIFKITTNGLLTLLALFNGANGSLPDASLVQGTDGNFYGTTIQGGDGGNDGTIFSVTPAGVLTSLASFNGADGSYPYAGLVRGRDGNFYGTTVYGGSDPGSNGTGLGTVFMMSPNGALTSLVSFNGTDGSHPDGTLVQGSDGNFYGTTYGGETGGSGGVFDYGDGTVFRVTTNGGLTTLASFNLADGANPYGGLVLATDGNFYGTTEAGGDQGCGTVFSLAGDGSLNSLFSFDYNLNGAYPTATLFQATDGCFYGTTSEGGYYGYGTVFKVTSDGTLTTLLNFAGINGAWPSAGVVQGPDGNLYGMTDSGGEYGDGTVFRVVPPPSPPAIAVQPLSQTVVAGGTALFTVNAAGSAPLSYDWWWNGEILTGATNATLSLTNVTTQNAGSYVVVVSNALGSVTSAPATLTIAVCVEPPPGLISWWPGQGNAVDVVGGRNGVLINGSGFAPAKVGEGFAFNGGTGYVQLPLNLFPLASVQPFSLELWFETEAGGVILGQQSQAPFNSMTSGWVPVLYVGTDGHLYAQLFWDGAFDQISTSTRVNDGTFHHLAVTYDGANQALYLDGVEVGAKPLPYSGYDIGLFTQLGAGYTQSWPAGNGGWYSFNGIIDEVTLYSAALTPAQILSIYNAGSAGKCTDELLPVIVDQPTNETAVVGGTAVFTVTATSVEPLTYQWYEGSADVAGATHATLMLPNVTLQNAGNYVVVVSSLSGSVTSAVVSLTVSSPPWFSFSGTNGANPDAALILGSDGNFYGTTASGGGENCGTIFKLTTNGVVTTLVSFNFSNGAYPTSALVQDRDGYFYGTTGAFYGGGAYTNGTVFKMAANGELTTLLSFQGTNGAWPNGGLPNSGLAQAADGSLYGTTLSGGDQAGDGTVFRITTNGALTTLYFCNQAMHPSVDNPFGLIQGKDGSLYGETENDFNLLEEASVFRMTTNGELTVLAQFNDFFCGIMQGNDGYLYCNDEYGIIFRINTNGSFTTFASFNGTNGYVPSPNGYNPSAPLIVGSDGSFYGTTESGGTYGYGTVFSLSTNGVLKTLFSFSGPDGSDPAAALVEGKDGYFYGTTAYGGVKGYGAIFRVPGPAPLLPSIVVQPLSQTVGIGDNVTFSVEATNGLLSYCWLVNNVAIAGANSATLSLPNVATGNVGNYVVIVSNFFGSVTSAVATLTVTNTGCVQPPPGIIAWWPGQSNAVDVVGGRNGVLMNGSGFAPAKVGEGFAFNGGTGYVQLPQNLFPWPSAQPFSIDLWFETEGGGVILGQQSQAPFNSMTSGWVPVLYVGTDGHLYAQLFWDGAFDQISTSTRVNDGTFHYLAVTYDGANQALYLDGVEVGAKPLPYSGYDIGLFTQLGAGYTQSWPAGNGGWYSFNGIIDEVTLYGTALTPAQILAIYNAGGAGKCSNEQLLPVIIAQPTNETVAAGGTAIFAVTATSSEPLAYQWLEGAANLIGATNSTLMLPNVTVQNGGSYLVIVSNLYGSVTSEVSTLTVTTTVTNTGCAEPPPGIIAWWPGQSNAVDIAGGHNGVLLYGVGFAPAEVGDGFAFTGGPGYVQLPQNLFPLANAQPFSIELWFETGAGGVLLAQQNGAPFNGTPNGWVPMLYVGTDGHLYAQLFWDGGFDQISTSVPVNGATFHHLAVTYDGANQALYLDGVEVGAKPLPYSSYDIGLPTQLGAGYTQSWPAGNGGWYPFNGILDEVTLYGNALTPAQILSIYNAGSAGKCTNEPLAVMAAQRANEAAAVRPAIFSVSITDLDQPLANALERTREVRMTITGPLGQVLRILGSTDLRSWQTITTLTNFTGTLRFTDSAASSYNGRFYKMVTP